ncbi:lasso peptide biosynthesis B2 protein [Tolypothrix sp. NIES-4075]|uniref:lasso peptide biosynthesis B2 protein n=1 Tax=Tolypothrix sp. NIES-4075 TaxID=2005459 RepID=UPI000B5C3AD1|nr:lasso peptide biosynthesis B2 protein [Tolypothrix sp. NIES-4075]
MRRLFKFFRISGSDRQLLVISLIILASIRLGLWLLPFRTLLKLLTKISQPMSNAQITNVTVGKIVWTVNAASRYMPGVMCLARALTTQVMMGRYGHSGQLRIGVAKTERGKLEAHAWVEYQGRVAIGNLQDLSRFIPLPSLEGVIL